MVFETIVGLDGTLTLSVGDKMALKLLGALRMMGEMAPLALNNLVLIETPIASQEKTISELAHQLEFAPCKRIQNPANFAVEIRNPEDWNPESTMVWNPESTMVWIPESRKLESGIRNSLCAPEHAQSLLSWDFFNSFPVIFLLNYSQMTKTSKIILHECDKEEVIYFDLH